jgi:hypothetical protein
MNCEEIHSYRDPLYFVKRGDLLDKDSIIMIKKLPFSDILVSIFRLFNKHNKYIYGLNHNVQHIWELPPLYEVERGPRG